MRFRKFKLKFLILSAVLITLSSGLLFYRQLFFDEFKVDHTNRTDIEELKLLDQKTNALMLEMRANFSLPSDDLLQTKNKMQDSVSVVTELRKTNRQIKDNLLAIQKYFKNKNSIIDKFLLDLRDLEAELKSLNPTYQELQKNNIKFTIDGKDFYRECITDALMFTLNPTKDVEWKINEDIKILGQIYGFSKTPNPIIEKYLKSIELIKKKNKEIESGLSLLKENNINKELDILISLEKNNSVLSYSRGEKFLILVFVSILLYIMTIIFVLRKL